MKGLLHSILPAQPRKAAAWLWCILGVGALIRVAAAVSFRPALFFSDSWAYIFMAYRSWPASFAPDRPSGYPVLLRLLAGPGRELEVVGVVQHLAGLAVGGLVFALLRFLGVRWWLAVAAAAIPLLDGQTIALERHLLAEPFFAFLLLVGVGLAIWRPRHVPALGASGLALALTCMLRTTGVFAIPVWLVYLVIKRPGTRGMLAALTGLVAPLVVYMALHARAGEGFGMTRMDGWFLYGRVAPFADCTREHFSTSARRFCPGPEHAGWTPSLFVWDSASPAKRVFPDQYAVGSNDALREFARSTIRAQPADYARTIGADLLLYFTPGARGRDQTIMFPATTTVPPLPDYAVVISRDHLRRDVHRTVTRLGPWLHRYADLVRVNQVLVALLFLSSAGALAAAIPSRTWRVGPHRAELLLTTGIAASLMAAPVLLVELWTRYAVPAFPLLAISAALAWEHLLHQARSTPRAVHHHADA